MNVSRVGDNISLPNLPSHTSGPILSGSGGVAVDYSTLQLEALRRAADKPAHIPAAATRGDLPPPGTDADTQLRWAAEQMEALLIHELLKSMRRTVMKTGMLDGPGVQLFEEMLDEERSKEMAATGGLGLAQLIYEQMAPHVSPSSVSSSQHESRTSEVVEENKFDEVL